MEYKHFDPGVVERAPHPVPAKKDLLAQIEADHYVAKNNNDKDLMRALDERYKKVSSAKTSSAARKAYDVAIKEQRPRGMDPGIPESDDE